MSSDIHIFQDGLKNSTEIKFIYCEKATKFEKHLTIFLAVLSSFKSNEKTFIQIFVAFSEYMNFCEKKKYMKCPAAFPLYFLKKQTQNWTKNEGFVGLAIIKESKNGNPLGTL